MPLTKAQIKQLAAGEGQLSARYRGRHTARLALGALTLDVLAVLEELADRLCGDDDEPTPTPLPAKKKAKGE